MAEVIVYPGKQFQWKNGGGYATLEDLGVGRFPKSFRIRSFRTGQVQTFVEDVQTMEANEFFDGEATAYISAEGTKVQIWN